jgi:hypothetical protein
MNLMNFIYLGASRMKNDKVGSGRGLPEKRTGGMSYLSHIAVWGYARSIGVYGLRLTIYRL